jgi:hypothetical protein
VSSATQAPARAQAALSSQQEQMLRQLLQGQSKFWDELRGMKSKLEGLEDLIADQPPWPDLD